MSSLFTKPLHRHTDTQTTETETERETDRQTETETDRERDTHTAHTRASRTFDNKRLDDINDKLKPRRCILEAEFRDSKVRGHVLRTKTRVIVFTRVLNGGEANIAVGHVKEGWPRKPITLWICGVPHCSAVEADVVDVHVDFCEVVLGHVMRRSVTARHGVKGEVCAVAVQKLNLPTKDVDARHWRKRNNQIVDPLVKTGG